MKTLKREITCFHLVDNWFIATDSLNIILLKRRIATNAARANAHNLGCETLEPVGYYSSIISLAYGLLMFLSKDEQQAIGPSTVIDCAQKLLNRFDEIEQLEEKLFCLLKERLGSFDV